MQAMYAGIPHQIVMNYVGLVVKYSVLTFKW